MVYEDDVALQAINIGPVLDLDDAGGKGGVRETFQYYKAFKKRSIQVIDAVAVTFFYRQYMVVDLFVVHT